MPQRLQADLNVFVSGHSSPTEAVEHERSGIDKCGQPWAQQVAISGIFARAFALLPAPYSAGLVVVLDFIPSLKLRLTG